MSYSRKQKKHLLVDQTPAIPLDEVELFQWKKRCPPLDDEAAWARLAKQKKRDMNDILHEGGQEGFMAWWNDTSNMVRVSLPRSEDPEQVSARRRGTPIISSLSLERFYPELKKPIIHGLIRQGETMNIVAPPKVGKSWLTGGIALSIIGGGDFLQKFKCEQGRVLIVDNELHCETIWDRLKMLSLESGVPLHEAGQRLDYWPLRGELMDLYDLEPVLSTIPIGHYNAIILDAFYKFFPEDMRENDNAQITALYNQIDYYAEVMNTAFILVHHASKGNQSEKGVTDVGAGGGAQSRAADCHLVIREHEDAGTYVIDAAVRSWAPVKAFCAKFVWPIWSLAENSDPSMLKGSKKGAGWEKVGGSGKGRGDGENAPTAQGKRSSEALIEKIVTPMDAKAIADLATSLGLRGYGYETLRKSLIALWLQQGLIRETRARVGNLAALYVRAGNPGDAPSDADYTASTGKAFEECEIAAESDGDDFSYEN